MRYIVLISLLLLGVCHVYGDYDPTKTLYPYEYELEEFTSLGNSGELETYSHNINAGSASANKGAFVNILIKDDDAYSLDCYDWYVEFFSEFQKTSGKKKIWVWNCFSAGTINLNRVTYDEDGIEEEGIDKTPKSSKFTILTTRAGYKYLSLNFNDVSDDTPISQNTYSFRVIIIKKSSCGGDEEIQEQFFMPGNWEFGGSYTLDFAPAPPPAAKPELKVKPIIAGCWSSGETFDLTRAKESVSPSDATIEYYTDAAGSEKIADPTKVQMSTISNPSSPTEVKKYYARAINAEGEKSDIQEIEVTFWQKPEVQLALANGETTVCYNDAITLQVTNLNNFTPGQYHYFRNEVSLAENSQASYTTNATAGATYYVYVTSGNSVGNCRDTASVDIAVTPVIAGSAVEIAVTDNKKTICYGESVELSVSVNGYNSSQIGYQWSTGSATERKDIEGETWNSISVDPKETTTYNVQVTLDGCTSDLSVASQLITVNPLPTFSPVNPDPVCSGVSNTVNITQSGTGNDYKYYSNEGATNAVADPTKVAAGDYWVTLTENGCTSKPQKVTATVNLSPEPKILVNDADPTASLCAGTEITLTASGADGCTHAWSSDATGTAVFSKVIIKEGANNFGLTVTSTANKCPGTAQVVAITGLKLPEVKIAEVDDVCADSEITLEATPIWVTSAGASGEWTKGGEKLTTTTSGGKLVATPQVVAGKNTYTVNLTDGNGCKVTETVDVTGNVLELAKLTVTPTSVKVGDKVLVQASASWNGSGLAKGLYTRVWKKIVADVETVVIDSTDVNLRDNPNIDQTRYKVVAERDGCRDSVTSDPVTVSTDPFVFSDPDNAIASVGKRFNVCYGEDLSANPVKWYVTVQGGSKEYTYNWKFPSSVTATATDDTLTITAIDYENFGNNQQISVEISDGVKTLSADQAFSVRPIPQIRINGANNGAVVQACKGISYDLTATVDGISSGLAYIWNTGSKNATIGASTDVAGTTAYRVTATFDGCSNTDSVKVQVNELPSVSLVAQVGGESVETVCPGTEITLVAVVDGVDSPVVKWLHANGLSGTQPTTTVGSLTTYEVEYEDGTTHCQATASTTVGVYGNVELDIAANPGLRVCPGTEVTLTVTKGDADTYVWTSSDEKEDMSAVKGATYTATPVSNTTYTVNGKDEHGCVARSMSVTLEVRDAPTLVLATHTLHGCKGLSVDMRSAVSNLGTATLEVRNAAGEVLEGTTVTAAGTYTIYINGGSCLSNEEIVEVQFHDLPTVTLAANSTAVCLGEVITLTAKGEGTELTYAPKPSWTDTPAKAGEASYTVTVTDKYKCTASASTSVTVKPLPDVSIGDPGSVCAGAEVTLRASGADTYVWTGGVADGTGETYKVTPTESSNTFSVTGTKDGCTAEPVSIKLTIQKAPVLANANTMEDCVGMPMDLQGAFNSGAYTLTFYNKDKVRLNETRITALTASDTLFYAKATSTQGSCDGEFVPVRVTVKPLPEFSISGLQEICLGEETVLTVEGNATKYAWSPAGKGGAIEGAEMTVNPTTATEYTITATGSNACKAEKKVKVQVNPVPTLTWDTDETALIAGDTKEWGISVSSGTGSYTYEWTQNGVVDENYTDAVYSLTGEEDVVLAVKVTDEKGCSVTSEKSITVTKLDELAVAIETGLAEDEELCIGNIAHLQVVATNGALTGDATYEWAPADGLDATDVANPVFTAESAGTKTYTVTVTEQGKPFTATVELVVKNFEAPVIGWHEDNPESFVMNESFIMKTKVIKGSSSGNHYTWLKPKFDDKTDLPQYSIQTANESAYDFAVIMTDANGCRTTDTLTTSISIGGADAIEIKVEKAPTACASAGTTVLSVEKTAGPDQVDYRWTRGSGNTLALKDDDASEVTVDFAGAPAGMYEFWITVTDRTNATNKKEERVLLTIIESPTVELADKCVALHKDSVFVLNVANEGDYEYLWQESLQGVDWENPTDQGTGVSQEVKMGNQNMRYILTAKDSRSGCPASDTAMIYRIPDAPSVEIDTNTNHLDIKLAWGGVSNNDGYTIWSRKWDPYCLTSADGGVYQEAGNTLRNEWAVPNMDTLEFFYVTADKNVCGTTYYSQTSDTVGYYMFDIQKNEAEGKSSFNFMPIYFDFAEMGCPTTLEVARRLRSTGNVVTMYIWDYVNQTTNVSSYMAMFDRATPTLSITKETGVLQITTVNAGRFLQYGKLPNASFEIKRTNENGVANLNWLYALPQKAPQFDLSELFKTDFQDVQILYRWDFADQTTKSTSNFNNRPVGDTSPLRPLMFMQVVLRSGTLYLWK